MPGPPLMTVDALRQRCEQLMPVVDRARAHPMERWLQPDAEGRTLKERYAEAAALAYQLRDEIRTHWFEPAAPPAVAAAARGDRRRRPVAVLITEIGNCLGAACNHLASAPQAAIVTDSMRELMEQMEALLTPEPAPEPPAR